MLWHDFFRIDHNQTMIRSKQQMSVFHNTGTTLQIDIAGHYRWKKETIKNLRIRIKPGHSIFGTQPDFSISILHYRLDYIIYQPVILIIMPEFQLIISLSWLADRKAFTGGSNPHTTFAVTKNITNFIATYFPIIQIINVILPRIIQQRIRMEYINTIIGSYPHPMIPISSNSTNLLLSKTPLQKMTKHKIVFLINSQIESSPESSNPHSIPVVPIDIINMIMCKWIHIISPMHIPSIAYT